MPLKGVSQSLKLLRNDIELEISGREREFGIAELPSLPHFLIKHRHFEPLSGEKTHLIQI